MEEVGGNTEGNGRQSGKAGSRGTVVCRRRSRRTGEDVAMDKERMEGLEEKLFRKGG
jgi:hypothetical protein